MMKIKIYGERNSGTNYLEKLIEANLDAKTLKFETNWWSAILLKTTKKDFIQDMLFQLQSKKILGWKHGCAPIEKINSYKSESLVIVTITKNPYSFLNSLYKKPYHLKGEKPKSLSNFISQKWITMRMDLCNKRKLNSPIELWNLKNKSYVDLKKRVNKKIINITYENLIKDPEKCINYIASEGNIRFRNEGVYQFQNYLTSTKTSELSYKNYREYYLQEKWKSEFSRVDLKYLNPKIDDELVKFFKYKKIEIETI